MNESRATYSKRELCRLAAVPERTVRYYTEKGVLPPPCGRTRGAWYDGTHLERLRAISRWRSEGLNLDQMRRIIAGEPVVVTEQVPTETGDVDIWKRFIIGDGVELVVDPERLALPPRQLETFQQEIKDILTRTISTSL